MYFDIDLDVCLLEFITSPLGVIVGPWMIYLQKFKRVHLIAELFHGMKIMACYNVTGWKHRLEGFGYFYWTS